MLRSDDVADKTFTTTRLREGYEIAEVDEFRTALVDAISVRDHVINDLQEELANVRVRLSEMSEQRETHERAVPAHDDEAEHVDGPRETSVYAARLLEQATVNADLLVAEAQAAADELRDAAQHEADELRTAAQHEADELRTIAQHEADELRTTARTEAETAAAELERHRAQVLGEVAEVQAELEARIANLRQQEADSRERLRRHLTEQLALLDDATPARLRAVAD